MPAEKDVAEPYGVRVLACWMQVAACVLTSSTPLAAGREAQLDAVDLTVSVDGDDRMPDHSMSKKRIGLSR